jgi:DNA mismatch endonuclease (patch repair protein)
VHGCYWHGHGCSKGQLPKSRMSYWSSKIRGNRERDRRNEQVLTELGWEHFTVWQCEIKNAESLQTRLIEFLGKP